MTGRGPLDFDDRDEPGDDVELGGPRRPAPAEPPPPARPVGASRYTWFLGVVAFLFIVLVLVNSIGSGGVSPGGPDIGDRLVPFAVPLAAAGSRPDEDANVDARTACRVRGPGILNICELAERGPVVLALFPTDGGDCRGILDQLTQVAARFRGRVQFAAVGSRGERATLRRRRTAIPLGWDRDGAVASIYGLVGCPQVTYARRGGAVMLTTRRRETSSQIAGHVRDLVDAPER